MPDPNSESPASESSSEPAAKEPLVRATFSVPVAGAFLNASALLPTGRTTLTELLPIVQNIENAIIARVEEEARAAGTPISCRAGCAACCRQMVPVSLFEAEALLEWMQSLPAERQQELAQRFHGALTALRDAGVIDKLVQEEWTLDEERTTRLAVDYFHARVACPFLEDENCSIHPIRPLACREYLVTSPPELCQDPSVNNVHGVMLPVKISRALYSFGREMEQDLRGWIPLVFLLAWAKSGARPGEFVAGTGQEVLRKFLGKLSELAEQEKV
jgi:Fe-S-cluster containining protein